MGGGLGGPERVPQMALDSDGRHRRQFNLGIFRIVPEKSEATKDQLKRVTADLHCERMELKYPGPG
jgi:hypothetical protein